MLMYVQHHRVTSPAGPHEFDGLAEARFAGREQMKTLFRSEGRARFIEPDEERLLAAQRSVVLLTRCEVLYERR
jgi:hypothetical protein